MMNAPDAPPRINPWVDAIQAYVPGKAPPPGEGAIAKLSSNENPFGPSPRAVEAMTEVLAGSHRYPDGASGHLREAIAAKYGLEADRIICGAGSDEILQLATTAFAGPGDEVLMSAHAFSVYPIAAQRVGATPIEAPDRDYRADVEALLAAVTPQTRMLFLANPNNPTGTVLSRAEVERLHAGLPSNVLLVYDGAYSEYLEKDPEYADGIALASQHPNVLVSRTFSKIHGLAAARVGWGYGDRRLIEAMDKARGPFNVTTAGQAGAAAALGDNDHAARAREHNAKWRDWLFAELSSLSNRGVRAVPSAANFVMLEMRGEVSAEAAYHGLRDRGFITRWLAPQGMDDCLRISIGTEEETRGVAEAFREVVGA